MLRSASILCAALAGATLAWAQEAPAPTLHAGDRWVYQVKMENPANGASTRRWEGTIQRVGAGSMVVALKAVDSNMPARETVVQDDWSLRRSLNGRTSTVDKLFDFPLRVDKTWATDVTQDRPNPQLKSLHNKMDYKVLGWEDVTVPAGTFHALKIEAAGEWSKEYEPTAAMAGGVVQSGPAGSTAIAQTRASAVPMPQAGRFYRAIWYAPEAKREVRSVFEDIDAAGTVISRKTDELESYQVQP